MSDDRVPIVYDTDLGEDIDDLYALYLALFHPRIRVMAVTTVHGDTQAKARLARKVLRMAGRADIPVGAGIGMSMARLAHGQEQPAPASSASYVRYVTCTDPESQQTFPAATEVINTALRNSPVPVALVGEGAFSNLAEAVVGKDASVREKVLCFAVMGGETQAVMSEYNVLCDPEAADVVFSSGMPVFMGTFFLTARLKMTMTEVADSFAEAGNPVHQVLRDCTALWGEMQLWGRPGPVLYDLVPIFWLVDPSSVKTRHSTIRVELVGRYTRGQTVRTTGEERGPVLESLELDPARLMQEFISILHKARPQSLCTEMR